MSLRLARATVFDRVPLFSGRPILTEEHKSYFLDNGFLIFSNFLKPSIVDDTLLHFDSVFKGDLETGIYPDEWYGARGMHLQNKMTREICNAWKCDSTIASVILSSQIHSITSQLLNWNGSRIAQDDLIWKENSGGTAVNFHQDCHYISKQFTPFKDNSITVWMPLDDVGLHNGSIEYISKSHKWNVNIDEHDLNFHSSDIGNNNDNTNNMINNHRDALVSYMKSVGGFNDMSDCECVYVEIPKGGVAFHHQNTWHGSSVNATEQMERRAIVAHTLNSDCKFNFNDNRVDYIYGKYVLDDGNGNCSDELNERFFPIAYHNETQKRSDWLTRFCNDQDILV